MKENFRKQKAQIESVAIAKQVILRCNAEGNYLPSAGALFAQRGRQPLAIPRNQRLSKSIGSGKKVWLDTKTQQVIKHTVREPPNTLSCSV